MYVLGNVTVPTRVSGRGYIARRESITVYGEDPRHYEPLVAIALNPEMIDFMIDHLPHGDGFTKELEEIRVEMRETLWQRTAG